MLNNGDEDKILLAPEFLALLRAVAALETPEIIYQEELRLLRDFGLITIRVVFKGVGTPRVAKGCTITDAGREYLATNPESDRV